MSNNFRTYLIAIAVFGILTLSSGSLRAQDSDAATPPPPPLTKAQKSEIRLQLDKANLDMKTGKTDDAAAIIDKLKAKYPDNAEVLAAEANLEGSGPRANNGPTLVNDLCQAANMDPSSSDILERQPSTSMVAKGTYGCGGYTRRITNEANEQIWHASGQTTLAPDLSVGLDIQNDQVNTRAPFIHANGTTQSFYGDKQQATANVDKMFGKDDEVTGRLFAIDDDVGAGLQYRHWDQWGSTSVRADFHRPNWDYIEAIVQDGTEDDITVERQQIFTKDIQGSISGSFKRYSLNHDGDDAEAPAWTAGLDYDHDFAVFGNGYNTQDDFVSFGAHYDLDAEYFTHVEKRLATGSVVFNPLPVTTYEIHTFTMSTAKTFYDVVKLAAFGGYGVNRILGNSGPLYGGSITYTPIKHLGIDIHGSRTLLGGQNESEKEDILGASLKWMW